MFTTNEAFVFAFVCSVLSSLFTYILSNIYTEYYRGCNYEYKKELAHYELQKLFKDNKEY